MDNIAVPCYRVRPEELEEGTGALKFMKRSLENEVIVCLIPAVA